MKEKEGVWVLNRERGGFVSYRCEVGRFILSVLNGHMDYPGVWLMSCYGLFENVPLRNINGQKEFAADAQEECLQKTMSILNDALGKMRSVQCDAGLLS